MLIPECSFLMLLLDFNLDKGCQLTLNTLNMHLLTKFC